MFGYMSASFFSFVGQNWEWNYLVMPDATYPREDKRKAPAHVDQFVIYLIALRLSQTRFLYYNEKC